MDVYWTSSQIVVLQQQEGANIYMKRVRMQLMYCSFLLTLTTFLSYFYVA